MSGISTSCGVARSSTWVAKGASPASSAGFSQPRGGLSRLAAAHGRSDRRRQRQRTDDQVAPAECAAINHRVVAYTAQPMMTAGIRSHDCGWTRSA